MASIDAYYQCYKRENCVDFVLNNYRKKYEESTCILFCDGGLDFSKIAKKYNCIYKIEERIGKNKNLVFETTDQILKFTNRIYESIKLMKNDFFIILEDDVYIINDIKYDTLKSDINGCNFGELLDQGLCELLKKHLKTSNSNFYIGACGGSVLRKSFFKEVLSKKETIEKDASEYLENCSKSNLASDRFLSYLCWKNGGTIGQYDGFCETWYPEYRMRIEKGDVDVLHQYKELY